MDVIYQTGRSWKQSPLAIAGVPNALVLSYNNWDDFGFGTTFNSAVFKDGICLYEFALKILVPGVKNTYQHFNDLVSAGWNGVFPPPGTNYVSIPSDIVLYEVLISAVGVDESKRILALTRDAGLLQSNSNAEDRAALQVILQSEGWSNSLMREAGAKKAFQDGWRVFEHSAPKKINDFSLYLPRQNGTMQPIDFAFNSTVLPYDINVLIGPNGVGKSYSLKTLVEYWLGVGAGDPLSLNGWKPFSNHPNISKLILVSYSPFEEFTLDLDGTQLQDKDAYRYFGFRHQIEEEGRKRIGINRNLPSKDSVESLTKAFEDDDAFDFLETWIGKVDIICEILSGAISFDELAFELDEGFSANPFETILIREIDGRRYIIPKTFSQVERALPNIQKTEGVVFLKEGRRVSLSSGQRLFCYIVINVVGEIKKDSMVIIDEPELFLHPKLEVEFIGLLKKINQAFNSCAVLATHSLSIARETPAKCVHVFRNLTDGLDIVHPPFETFGGDMQRISTYVFGDDSFSKPFETWLTAKLDALDDPRQLIAALGKEVNEELVVKILNYEGTHGRQNSNS
ncbi:ATP-binding protein [Pseudomonas coleopterorum]|uniref:AAA family ATPase n=1 Tax=Pseudomonas coleopterorum TaxID=1605838 RepID=A0ABR9C0J7_9PSED|nr:ATP-binding protein [Pseudomonas coleopterorum]MBD8753825.1 AAA family ATPase [Pseudomonas coleopterorum]MBD8770873.1 AAA family ATPase [Pseudomonas coleopterorum]